MATVAIMVGGAVLNAATFIGGNYLAKYLSGDSGHFQDTDEALALYNQTHRAKVAMPKEPQFSDYYKPSPQQKNGELLFIGAGTLALGFAAFRFL